MRRLLACLVLCAACAGHQQRANVLPAIPISVGSLQADSIAQVLVRRAFDADAQLEVPDSLYIANAEIIADGAPRSDPPRIAGVSQGGSVQLGSSRFAVTGNYVWGTIEYRWVPGDEHAHMVAGWATLIIGRLKNGEWRILHVHSSTAPDTRPTTL
jgi:hypothetical protein